MKNKISLLVFMLIGICQWLYADSRHVYNFNFDWRFMSGEVRGAEQLEFDDSSWRRVDVPHDFQIEQPWVAPGADERADNSDPGANIRSRLSSRGFKEMGIGWYRKTFTPDEAWKNKRVVVDFEGIMYVGDVYLNDVQKNHIPSSMLLSDFYTKHCISINTTIRNFIIQMSPYCVNISESAFISFPLRKKSEDPGILDTL